MSWLKMCMAICGDNDKKEGEDKEDSVIVHNYPPIQKAIPLHYQKKIIVSAAPKTPKIEHNPSAEPYII